MSNQEHPTSETYTWAPDAQGAKDGPGMPAADQVVKVPCVHSECKGKGFYRVGASCTNCGWKGTLEITKGHEFSRWTNCPRCDCTYTLMRR